MLMTTENTSKRMTGEQKNNPKKNTREKVRMEPLMGIEPTTYALPRHRYTP